MGKLMNDGKEGSRPISLPKIALEINANKESRPRERAGKSPLFFEFTNLKTSTLLPTYKPARLYAPDDVSEWYVEYYFLIPGTNSYQRFKERFNINRKKNIAEKRQYGEEIVNFINKKLADGYNPFEAKKRKGAPPVFIVDRTGLAEVRELVLCQNGTDDD